MDVNKNGVLNASEVSASEKVCNSGGLIMLVDINLEPVGVNCPNDGQRIDAGLDTNTNTSLDATEITQT